MINRILISMLAIVIMLGSCAKEDLTDINSRLTSLEDWKLSVNKNISSLQSLVKAFEQNDFVSDVSPLPDGSGYQITFTKGGPIVIKHGVAGSTPVIGTRQHTDGKYYWTINGEWLLSGTTKMPLVGEKGNTGESPRIGSNGNWWIGTTDTGVRAQGDAIFANNGLDYSNPSYIEVTLADGTTKIQIPKYRPFKIGKDATNDVLEISSATTIALDMPTGLKEADFTAILAQVFSDQGTGNHIQTRAANSPWSITLNKPTFINGVCNNDATIELTPPSKIEDAEKALIKISIITAEGTKLIATRTVRFVMLYQVGDYYPDPNVTFNSDKTVASGTAPIGIVFRLDNPANGKSRNGLIVKLDESSTPLKWSLESVNVGAIDTINGLANMRKVKEHNDDYSNYPAYKYIHELNNGTPNYADDSKRVWYLPAQGELKALYATYNQSRDPENPGSINYYAQSTFNKKIVSAGGSPLLPNQYWSSTETSINDLAWFANFQQGLESFFFKSYTNKVRAISAF